METRALCLTNAARSLVSPAVAWTLPRRAAASLPARAVGTTVTRYMHELTEAGGKKGAVKHGPSVRVEETWHEDSKKFIVDKGRATLVGSRFFQKNAKVQTQEPLVKELLKLDGVTDVLLQPRDLCITKTPAADWKKLEPAVVELVKRRADQIAALRSDEYLNCCGAAQAAGQAAAPGEGDDSLCHADRASDAAHPSPIPEEAPADLPPERRVRTGPVVDRIVKVLESDIRPALQGDGGDVSFVSFDPKEGAVSVMLRGACAHCAMAGDTLKFAVEARLTDSLPEVKKVVRVRRVMPATPAKVAPAAVADAKADPAKP